MRCFAGIFPAVLDSCFLIRMIFWGNLTNWNIFLLVYQSFGCVGFKEKKWWLFAVSTFVICFGILIIVLPEFSLCLFFIFAGKTGIGGCFVYVELPSGSVWRQS